MQPWEGKIPEEVDQPCCCLDAVLMDMKKKTIPAKFLYESTAPFLVLKSLNVLLLHDGREALFLSVRRGL
eukprot:658570-Pleurochrysis_carterae.AAC.1